MSHFFTKLSSEDRDLSRPGIHARHRRPRHTCAMQSSIPCPTWVKGKARPGQDNALVGQMGKDNLNHPILRVVRSLG